MFTKTILATAATLAVGIGATASTVTPADARSGFSFYFGAPCCYYQPYYPRYYYPHYYQPYYVRPHYNYYYPRRFYNYAYRPYFYYRNYHRY